MTILLKTIHRFLHCLEKKLKTHLQKDEPGFGLILPKSPQEAHRNLFYEGLESDMKFLHSSADWWSFYGVNVITGVLDQLTEEEASKVSTYTTDQFEDRAGKLARLVHRLSVKYPFLSRDYPYGPA